MKIIRGEGGFGCQMSQIVLYERLKMVDPETYVETSSYNLYPLHNGWEVDKIFNLKLNKIDYSKEVKKGKLPFFKRKKIKLIRIFNKSYKRYDNYFSEWTSKETEEKYENYFKKNIKSPVEINKVFMCVGTKVNEEDLNYSKNSYYVGSYYPNFLFKGNEKKIREMFQFPEFENTKNIELIGKYKDKETVSVHIRRGDYIDNPVLGGLGNTNYYKEAMDLIRKKIKNPVFIIFSNDIDWCKKEFIIPEEHVYVNWNNGKESFRDMQLMSLLKNNIITNSTFSWWGAWLNKNPRKIVIAPKRWFNKNSKIPEEGICDSSWITINNTHK